MSSWANWSKWNISNLIQVFSYVAIPKAWRRNKINTTHRVPTLTLQYIVTTDAATSSLHKFPMANVGSERRRAESSHKKRRMNAFTKLIKPHTMFSYILIVGFAGCKNPQMILNFPQRLSENAKCIKIIVFAELLTAISSIYVQSLQQIVNKNIKTHYIPKKNATLTPNSSDFYDLLTFVAKFCGQNLCTFSADFFRLKSKIRRLLYF